MDIVACLLAPWSSGKDPDRYTWSVRMDARGGDHASRMPVYATISTTVRSRFQCTRSSCEYGTASLQPQRTLLTEETWRKASLGFFKLCGQQIMECCSLCGPTSRGMCRDAVMSAIYKGNREGITTIVRPPFAADATK
jgi:hypothetical protein